MAEPDFVVDADEAIDKTNNLKPSAYNSLKYDRYIRQHTKSDTSISLSYDDEDEFEAKIEKYNARDKNRQSKYLEFEPLKIDEGDEESSNSENDAELIASRNMYENQNPFDTPSLDTNNNVDSNKSNKSNKSKKMGKSLKKNVTSAKGSKNKTRDSDFNEFSVPFLAYEIAEFVPDETIAKQKLKHIKKYPIISKDSIKDIEIAFKEFEAILENRKNECLKFANNCLKLKQSGDTESQTRTLVIDFENTKKMLNQIGTSLGEKEYELKNEQLLCIDKLREFVYFEDYSNSVSANLTKIKQTYEKESLSLENEKLAVKNELNNVLRILNEANESISKIPKSTFNEFRALRQPTPIINKVMQAVILMSGQANIDVITKMQWKDIKKTFLSSSKFMDKIIKFKFDIRNEQNLKARDIINTQFLSKSNFTYERVNQANAVAGQFVLWLQSQMVCFLFFFVFFVLVFVFVSQKCTVTAVFHFF